MYPAAAATLHHHQQDLRILHSAQLRELETVIAELRLGGNGEKPANVKYSYMVNSLLILLQGGEDS